MFGGDMTIDNGVEEEEEWVAPRNTFFCPPVQPQSFTQPSAPFGVTAFPSPSSWQFPITQPVLQPPDISTSSFISQSNPFFPSPSPTLPFMQNEPSPFLQASSFISTSLPCNLLGEPKKRKRKDRDMMVDSEEPSSPSERAQVKVVSKRMRMMKPFGNPPFMLDKTEILKDKAVLGGPTISIKVKTLSGKVMSLIVDPEDTIQELKEYLEEKSGVPATQQRLIFRGKQVADTKTLAEYKVETGSVLHLVLALRGGAS